MTLNKGKIDRIVRDLKKSNAIENLEKLNTQKPDFDSAVPMNSPYKKEGQVSRLKYVQQKTGKSLEFLSGERSFSDHEVLEGNIENYIGMSMIPTGIIGPLMVNGTSARGGYYIPLATSEGALVASYSRGVKACREAGYITSVCLMEGVQRSPLFKFKNLIELGKFVMWALESRESFVRLTANCSRYAKLNDLTVNIEGNTVIITFEFTTGDASGQNMVTICTDKICQYILENSPVKPEHWFIESNYSGDKKATALSFTNGRGKKVTAEIEVPRKIVERTLKSTPEKMAEYWKSSTLAVIESGSIGAQGHIANGLAALFLATGQDVACVSEAAVGITRMEVTKEGNLYASVTLPNLIVGTVGGGTHLPTQRECLELMDCYGEGNARKLAEICGALSLAGELSIAAAISAGHFAKAHQVLGRKKK